MRTQRKHVSSPVASWHNFSPLAYGPSMWFDAADLTTITESGGLVSSWADKSGNGRTATQETSANQPTTNVDAQNGLNLLTFNGTSNWMITASYPPPATGFTVFAVANLTTNKNATIWEQCLPGNDRNGRRYLWHSSTIVGADRFVFGYADGSNYRDYITTWPFAGGIRIAMGAVIGSQIAMRLSPNNENVFNRVNYPTAVSKPCRIGVNNDSAWYWKGTIGEVIVYDYELTLSARQRVYEYLKFKWAI